MGFFKNFVAKILTQVSAPLYSYLCFADLFCAKRCSSLIVCYWDPLSDLAYIAVFFKRIALRFFGHKNQPELSYHCRAHLQEPDTQFDLKSYLLLLVNPI